MISTRWVFAIPLFLLSGLLYGARGSESLLDCDHDKYFEGQKIICTIHQDRMKDILPKEMNVTWTLSDQDVKQEHVDLLWPFGRNPTVDFMVPIKLNSVGRLRLEVAFSSGKGTVAMSSGKFILFPKKPKFWPAENEFKGKTIVVEKSVGWVTKDLDALHIPYSFNKGSKKLSPRMDVPLNDSSLKGFDRTDPWARWTLLQMIRHAMSADKPNRPS